MRPSSPLRRFRRKAAFLITPSLILKSFNFPSYEALPWRRFFAVIHLMVFYSRETNLSPPRAPRRSLLPLSPRRTQVRLKPLLNSTRYRVPEKTPGSISGWALRPGAIRRSLTDPQRVWEKLQDVLTTEQFLCTVKVEVGKLQDLWAGASGIPKGSRETVLPMAR